MHCPKFCNSLDGLHRQRHYSPPARFEQHLQLLPLHHRSRTLPLIPHPDFHLALETLLPRLDRLRSMEDGVPRLQLGVDCKLRLRRLHRLAGYILILPAGAASHRREHELVVCFLRHGNGDRRSPLHLLCSETLPRTAEERSGFFWTP